MDTAKLVNWDPEKKTFQYLIYRAIPDPSETLLNMTRKRHPAIEELVEAIGKFWDRLETGKKQCAPCFKGENPITGIPKHHHGCCGACPNLGETGCVAKPIACALYACGSLLSHLPQEQRSRVWKLVDGAHQIWLHKGYYASGYAKELAWEPTRTEIAKLRLLRRKFDRFELIPSR